MDKFDSLIDTSFPDENRLEENLTEEDFADENVLVENILNESKSNNHLKKILFIVFSTVMTILVLISLVLYFIFAFNHTQAANAEENKFADLDLPARLCNNYVEEQKALRITKDSEPITDEQYNNLQNIYAPGEEKVVYLTFDDGPSANITPLILDLLKQEGIKATFFILGNNANHHPELVQRAYNEGHYIANHGYSHRYSEIYESPDTILNDYIRCNQALKNALNNPNYESKVYRYPGGSTGGKYHDIKAEGKNVLRDNHIAYLDWNALTCDAEGTPTKESIMENLQNTVGEKNSIVLLMHDSSSKILTYETLPDVIAFFRERGYTFKNLYDVL